MYPRRGSCKLDHAREQPGDLLKPRWLRPTARDSVSAGQGWGLGPHTSAKLPGDALLLVQDHSVHKEGLGSLWHPGEAEDLVSDYPS